MHWVEWNGFFCRQRNRKHERERDKRRQTTLLSSAFLCNSLSEGNKVIKTSRKQKKKRKGKNIIRRRREREMKRNKQRHYINVMIITLPSSFPFVHTFILEDFFIMIFSLLSCVKWFGHKKQALNKRWSKKRTIKAHKNQIDYVQMVGKLSYVIVLDCHYHSGFLLEKNLNAFSWELEIWFNFIHFFLNMMKNVIKLKSVN